MKTKKQFTKVIVTLLCSGLIFALCPFVHIVSAKTVSTKTVYKTLAFDKRIETKGDFLKGQLKNLKIEEKDGKIGMSLSAGKNGEYVSPVVRTPFKATHIGMHWREELTYGSSINVYLRTSNDGKNFSQWVKTHPERETGRDGIQEEETFASLVGTEKAAFAQAKIEFFSGEESFPKLKTLTFTFLNSAEESRQEIKKFGPVPFDILTQDTVEKTSPNGHIINVITREGWGANEEYRLSADGTELWPRSYHGTRKLIIHHTADANSNGVTDLEKNKATVRNIYYYHAVIRGWGDIGYNALVDAAGNIYEGKYGTHYLASRPSTPEPEQVMVLDVEAAHAASYNSGSFGISALGDFTDFSVPDTQLSGIKDGLTFVADSRGINPQGKSDFLRYDGSWHYDLNNLVGHRDVGQTACPGNLFYSCLKGVKDYIGNLMLPNLTNFCATASSISTGNVSGNNIGPGAIMFEWSSLAGAAQYQYVLEKVFGETGVSGEPWELAWLNSENTNMITTPNPSVLFEPNDLDDESNYVFYVRALDDTGAITSSVSHLNFIKDENNIIVDNLDDSYTNTIVSGWSHSTNVSGFYARDYQPHIKKDGSSIFEWSPNLFKDGFYDVSVWYTAAFDRAKNAPYTITYQDAKGTNLYKTIKVNQKTNGGKWVSLDTFYFSDKAGNSAKIQLSDDARGYVIADAVKFTWNPGETPPPPPQCVKDGKYCNCNGKCDKFETSESCSWDCY